MEKRTLLAVAVCTVLVAGWWLLESKVFKHNEPQTPTAQTVPAAKPATLPPAPSAPPPPSPEKANPAPGEKAQVVAAPPSAKPAANVLPPEQRTTIQRDKLWRATFSTWSAAPVEFTLLGKRFTHNVDGKEVPIDLVRKPPASNADDGYPLSTSFLDQGAEAEKSDFALPPNHAPWKLTKQTDSELVYEVDVGDVHLTKTWQLPANDYDLQVTLTVENRGQKAVTERLIVTTPGYQDPNVKQGGFLSFGRRVNMSRAECLVGTKVQRKHLSEAIEKPLAEAGDVRWIGIGDQFFLASAAFPAVDAGEARTCNLYGDGSGRLSARAVFGARTVAAGQKTVYPMVGYFGPASLAKLDAVTVAGQSAKLDSAIDYTLEWIAKPMFWVTAKIQAVVVNWGVAIIVITLLLKLLLFWPTLRSMQSARKMAKLKPEIDKLKAKYGDDKAGFSQAQMALFKQKGVSPLGGCLPMAIQMPIIFAFYSMLGNTAELYHAAFFGPIKDLTEPFWPLAIASGAVTFIQQKLAPTSPDSQQQKMMLYMMPVMFTIFTLMVPSGLALYLFVNTLLSMGQQWYINNRDPIALPQPATAPQGKRPKK